MKWNTEHRNSLKGQNDWIIKLKKSFECWAFLCLFPRLNPHGCIKTKCFIRVEELLAVQDILFPILHLLRKQVSNKADPPRSIQRKYESRKGQDIYGKGGFKSICRHFQRTDHVWISRSIFRVPLESPFMDSLLNKVLSRQKTYRKGSSPLSCSDCNVPGCA